MCCAGVLLMGVAPRIPGGGGKFKKAITDLANTEKMLLWTNPNISASNENWDIVLDKPYAAIYVTVTEYSGSYDSQNSTYVVMGASSYITTRGWYRYCTFDGTNFHAGIAHTGSGTSYSNVQPYKIYGVVGTEL